MRNFVMAAAAAAIFLTAPTIAHACSDNEYSRALERVSDYLKQNPNKQADANQKWQQIRSGYGGSIPEGQRCNAVQQLLAQLQSDR